MPTRELEIAETERLATTAERGTRSLLMDKTPRRVTESNPTISFRHHFQVTIYFTKQLGMGMGTS